MFPRVDTTLAMPYTAWDINKPKLVEQMLKDGVSPNNKFGAEQPPLAWALRYHGNPRSALLLVRAGAKLDTPIDENLTGLMLAALQNNADAVALMLKMGANPKVRAKPMPGSGNSLKNAGGTALDLARLRKSTKVIPLLEKAMGLKAGAGLTLVEKVRSLASPKLDFEGSDYAVTEALVGANVESSFVTVGETGDGSRIAVWLLAPGASLTSPVAYFDSEGDPFAVFAKTLAEACSVLPYGIGFLHDVLTGKKPDAKKALARGGAATEWRKATGVSAAKDPAKVIAAAREAFDVEEWLATKRKPARTKKKR